ncbi:macro domain-containing protein [Hymenobacter glacialis]|uniref:Macro domain-containing protein n=1 Tax=Hymenobacter glacialis TaxID=1908236 RepID=A0A1G1SYW1_9BACT|nr:hypothetical protein [Hymenobacter glacialis]OGX83804.1 hypothetical protein BEN48_03295 [Hymenobacter glacialis]
MNGVDAIVNAANSSLLGGGRAIHCADGSATLDQCHAIRVRAWLVAHDFLRTVAFVAFDNEIRRLYEQEVPAA